MIVELREKVFIDGEIVNRIARSLRRQSPESDYSTAFRSM